MKRGVDKVGINENWNNHEVILGIMIGIVVATTMGITMYHHIG